jgi:hypothetical protein
VPADIPLLALVGGFLGAGKTTLLLRAARELQQSGMRVAIITNDQGGSLVDTRLAESAGIATEEVVGGCYCCRFSDFIASAERLLVHAPHVILAEPVGSCIDISATTLQPVRRLYGDRFRLAPFTVLVDPARAQELLAADADPSLAYLFRNQLEEADLVCVTKSDLHAEPPALPGGYVLRLSARTGEGVSEWLRELLGGGRQVATRTLEVDYDVYAGAEASLGWLNWQATLHLRRAMSPATVVGPLLDDIDRALSESGSAIAHMKIYGQARTGFIKAATCRNGEMPFVEGDLAASPAREHELILNLRASGDPETLRAIVTQAGARLPGATTIHRFECFRPAPPKPEYRMAGPAG